MRDSFADTLVRLGHEIPNLVVLDGDVANSTKTYRFYKEHPDRFVFGGIAEQNMAGVAAGLAAAGLKPVMVTFAVFVTSRALDQIRMTIAQTNLPVVLIGAYSGLLAGKTGKTHICVDDFSVFRAMPNMQVAAPVDALDLEWVLRWALSQVDKPTYIRVARDGVPDILSPERHEFRPGGVVTLREGADVALVSTGTQTGRTLEAAKLLAEEGIDASVFHVPVLKPLDEKEVAAALSGFDLVVTVEEHTVMGGLGGAVTEILSQRSPRHVVRLGLQDTFAESASNDDLLDKYRLSPNRVAEDVAEAVRRHRSR